MFKNRPDVTSDADKVSLLREAILDPTLKAQVEQYGRGPDGFNSAMEALRIRYGRATVVFPVYVKEMIQQDCYEYTQDSMLRILDRTKHLEAAMKSIKGNTLSQVMVQLAVMNFNDELNKEWTKFRAGKDDIPDLDQLVKFVEPLSHTLPFQQQAASATKQQQQRKDSTRKQSNGDSKFVPHLVDCPLCKNAYHPLHRCSVFMDYTTTQRQGYINRSRSCVNCLHHSHVVSHCSSNHTRRQCKGRHHTLLHKEDSPAAPPATPALIATPAAMDKTVGVELAPPAKAEAADLPIRRGFVLTALMTLCFGDRKVVVRAGLDTCSGSSMVSERIASMLHVKRHSTHLDMSGLVSDTTVKQYCTLNISTALPSDFDLELSMAIASRIPDSTPPPNIQSVLNNSIIKGERLTDGHLGGKIDVLISTGDLSYFLLPDHIRICPQSGLTAVSTVFGWSLMGRLKDDDQVTMMRVELVPNETHRACTKP